MRLSLTELLSWMQKSPRTYDWNAIVSYDRSKTNTVLLQEYIGRFSVDSYFPPFEGSIPSTENEVEYIYDYIVDAPRLSFENATIAKSEAKLTMWILGGAQLTIAAEVGRSPAVIRVSSYDALQGPKLTMDLDLRVVQGTVDSAGKVQIDLKSGANPLLYYAPTRNQREKGGAYMLNRFKALEPELTEFELNDIGSQEGQFLKPDQFFIRTHAEPGAKVARAVNYGEGAVLLFISMEDENNGTLPATDADMNFLIPSGDYSSTILMGQRFMLRRIIVEACRKIAAGGTFAYKLTGPEQGFAEGVAVTAGEHRGAAISTSLPNFSNLSLAGFRLSLTPNFSVTIPKGEGTLELDWSGSQQQACSITVPGEGQKQGNVDVSWKTQVSYKFELSSDSGELVLKRLDETPPQVKVAPGDFADIHSVAQNFSEIAHYLEAQLLSELENCMLIFTSLVEEIDIFRLNSLLFRGANIVHFKSTHLPGDLALIGELAPDLTHFVVTPLEPLVPHGGAQQFQTIPIVQGLTWRVDNIEGHTGDPGSIDSTTGRYTAPLQDAIDGFFIRVRVTASKGEYSNSALVTVLVRDIVINPMIQICNASEGATRYTREVAAGSMGGGALTWRIVGNTGSEIRPSEVEGGDHTYVSRPKADGEKYTLDEIVVEKGSGRSESAWVLVIHGLVNGQIKIDSTAGLPEGQVKLLFDLGEGPVTQGVTWSVMKGSGLVDQDGIYTMDPDGQYRFALIIAVLPPIFPGLPTFYAHFILPLPLIDLPVLVKTLDQSDKYFKAAARVGMEEAARVAGYEHYLERRHE